VTRIGPRARKRHTIRAALLVACAVMAGAGPAAAQISLVDHPSVKLDLTGYVRTLTGVHDAGYDLPGATRITGFHGAVTRLKWTLTVPEKGVLTVHQRILASLTTSGASPVAGFGVSRTPGRAVDLSSPWIEEDRLSVVHDFDRLAGTELFTRQLVDGMRSVKRIRTMDLTLLKPYFQGTTSRSGAPFWFGSHLP